jgi:Phosphotransferase enzyme family
MADELLPRALREFRVTVAGTGTQPDATSGAGVWAARTDSGRAAYLKITPAGPAADRELHFYRAIAPLAPVRTPALIDSRTDDTGVALLLTSAGDPRPPTSWTPDLWASLGAALAALHTMPIPTDATRAPPGPSPSGALPPIDLRFWAGRLSSLPDRDALLAAMTALPPVFTHGDCHTANLLHGPAGLAFCDWQSSGPGRPSADLAFPSVRATPSGTVVPAALLDAYLDARPVDRLVLARAILAEELATFLCHWPPYAPHNTPTGVAHVVDRTRALARRWLDLTHSGG